MIRDANDKVKEIIVDLPDEIYKILIEKDLFTKAILIAKK